MKTTTYTCDGCGKETDEIFHIDLSGEKMDLCRVCGTAVSEAITEALVKVTNGKYTPKIDGVLE